MAAEKDFENQIKRWFQSIGIYPAGMPEDRMIAEPIGWYTKIWGGGYQKAGIPDLICNFCGYFLAVEIKADDGHPSQLQLLNVDRIRSTGGEAVVLYPSGFEQFQNDINYILKFYDYVKTDKFRKEYR